MAWWSKLFGSKPAQEPKPEPRASWIPAEKNPFGMPVLDLISITGGLLSTTSDPACAERSTSWHTKPVAELALAFTSTESLACNLRYVVERDLSDGWLFTPAAMEQKWAIAYRGGVIYLIRSWTAQVAAIAHTRRDDDRLVIERIELEGEMLGIFGDPVETFDWVLRAHALGERLPLPVDDEGAQALESAPLSVFAPFGNVAVCAATRWSPPPPRQPLRSTTDLVTAVRNEQPARVAALAASGAALDARSPAGGYTALHVAVIRGSVALVKQLLELGADPNVLADNDASTIITAVVHGAPIEILDVLAQHGAVAGTPNGDGFRMIHAIAETDRAEYLPWALAHGLDLEARTRHGNTPLHIAAALGHVATLRALLAAGADRLARDPSGATARDIAAAEAKPASVKALKPPG